MLDASSILHAWDNYPADQFPPLWIWLALEAGTGQLTIADVALTEVGNKSPECANWLRAHRIRVLPTTQAVLLDALRIKGLIGIVGDSFGSGVGENDLFIIAGARAQGAELVTEERRQPDLPQTLRRNYKIPAVCKMVEVQVRSINFIEYLKSSQQVFR